MTDSERDTAILCQGPVIDRSSAYPTTRIFAYANTRQAILRPIVRNLCRCLPVGAPF